MKVIQKKLIIDKISKDSYDFLNDLYKLIAHNFRNRSIKYACELHLKIKKIIYLIHNYIIQQNMVCVTS